jgi:hypothetical protein
VTRVIRLHARMYGEPATVSRLPARIRIGICSRFAGHALRHRNGVAEVAEANQPLTIFIP